MNYIYDILLNFQSMLYDFYEWNLNDDIIHIRKIPVFHITQKQLDEIRDNKVRLNQDFLVKIYKKTEMFTKKEVELISYTCIFSSEEEALAVKLDKNGNVLKKSKLLVEEEVETLDVAERLSVLPLNYKIIKKDTIIQHKTRKEVYLEKKLRKELYRLKDHNIEKLKYLYYECFDQKENDVNEIMTSFDHVLQKEWNPIVDKINGFFKLTQSQK